MSKDKRDDDAKKIVKEETEPTGESDAPGPTPEKPENTGGFRDLFEDMWSNLEGTVKLTNLSAYSAPSPLSKLLILHPSVDRFRLQNSRFLLNLTIPGCVLDQ